MQRQDVTKDRAKQRMVETLQSITLDAEAGKLTTDPKMHPIRRISEPLEGSGVETKDLASLLVERLEMQGYTLVFDSELAQRTIQQAVDRIQGLKG